MKELILKVIIRIFNKVDYIFNEFISFVISRQILYKINFYFYKKILIGIGINLNYDIYKSGEYEFLNSYLKTIKEPIVFDVGANIGDYSRAIKKINKDAVIYAFEPHPINFNKLKENMKSYDGISLVNKGLGKEKGNLYIYDYKNNDGSPRASIYKEVIEFMYGSSTVKHEIELDTIDNFLEKNRINKIDLLKIDTEGNELDVLRGALKSINNGYINVIQFEFNYTNIIPRNFLYDFFIILKDYDLYRLLRKGMVKLKNEPYNEIFLFQNIVAIKKSI